MEPVEAAQESKTMKIHFFSSAMAAAVLWLGSMTVSHGQEPVSTGIVQGTVPAAGTLTIRSDQTTTPLTFWGMERANIFTADGQLATVGDIEPGMPVTVQYAVRGKRWYISKVILPEQRANVVIGAPINIDPALRTRAANDNDPTTNPGSAAAIDNDITTVPASNSNGSGARIPVRRRAP